MWVFFGHCAVVFFFFIWQRIRGPKTASLGLFFSLRYPYVHLLGGFFKHSWIISTSEKLGEMMIQFDKQHTFQTGGLVENHQLVIHFPGSVAPIPGSPVFLHARYEEGRQSGTVSWWIPRPQKRRCPKHHTLGTFYDHNTGYVENGWTN